MGSGGGRGGGGGGRGCASLAGWDWDWGCACTFEKQTIIRKVPINDSPVILKFFIILSTTSHGRKKVASRIEPIIFI